MSLFELDSDEKAKIEQLWSASVILSSEDNEQSIAKALVGRVNVRLDLVGAFKAATKTALLAVKLAKAKASGGLNPFDWIDVSLEAFGAAQAVFGALVEKMEPLDYLISVVLSLQDEPASIEALEDLVRDFLDGDISAQFPWYLGLNSEYLRRAKEKLNSVNAFSVEVSKLRDAGFIIGPDSELQFKPRHFTLGLFEE